MTPVRINILPEKTDYYGFHVWQHDYGRKIEMTGIGADDWFQFGDWTRNVTIDVIPEENNGVYSAEIPMDILASPFPFMCYVYRKFENATFTVAKIFFRKHRRQIPSLRYL